MTGDADRFVSDVLTHGIGFTLNGKYIPLEQVYIMPEPKELPLYTCHKKVRALEIRSIGHYAYEPSPAARIVREVVFADPAFPSIMVSEDLLERYTPMPGDYYVVYEDGYASFSPRKAFLEGYSLAGDGNDLMRDLSAIADIGGNDSISRVMRDSEVWKLMSRVAREAYVTINVLKHQVEQLEKRNHEEADPR